MSFVNVILHLLLIFLSSRDRPPTTFHIFLASFHLMLLILLVSSCHRDTVTMTIAYRSLNGMAPQYLAADL